MYNKKINKESSMFTHGIQKRGISAIVATVLIILITVAASTILWVSVNSFVGDKLTEGTACLDAVPGLQLSDTGYTCYDDDDLKLQIKHGPEAFDLEEIQVLVYAAGTATPLKISSGFPASNEVKVFTLSHGITNEDTIEKVTIAPVIPFGSSNKTCDVSGSIEIKACA